jgi:hypothetical protein
MARVILLTIVLAVVVLVGADTVHARTKAFCSAKRSVTILRTERVRIFRKGRFLYGCDKRAGVRIRLAPARLGFENVLNFKVANYFVAYTLRGEPSSTAGPFSRTDLHWVDLRHKRRLKPATGCDRRREISDGNLVRGLVLSVTGALAWTCSDVAAAEVHKLDRNGPALLDTAPAPGDMDLAMSDGPGIVVVYWLNGLQAHSAVLTGF